MENINQDSIENYSDTSSSKEFATENRNPNDPTWGSWEAFFVWLASIVFIAVIPILFVMPYLARQTNLLADKTELADFLKSDPTALLLSVIAVIPAHILTLALTWLVVTRFKKFPFRESLGWRSGGFTIWHYVVILLGIFAIAGVTSYYFPEQDNDMLRVLRSSRAAVFVIAFLATFTAPLVEEVVYRGVLYSAFQKKFGIVVGVLLTTFLFAIIHVPQYYPSYSTIFLIVLLSLILTLVRVRANNLLPCVILHTIFNGIQSLLLIFQPYIETVNPQENAAAIIHIFK